MFMTSLRDSQLAELAKTVKILKSDFIYVDEVGSIYGFNKDFTVIRSCNAKIPDVQMPYIFRTLDFNAFIKLKSECIWVNGGCKSELIPYKFGDKPDPTFLYSGLYLKNTFDCKLFTVLSTINANQVLYRIDDFQLNPQFRQVYDMPSDKGASLIPDYGLYIYKGLIPLASKDSLTLISYQMNLMPDYMLVDFLVTKPKGVQIHTYIIYLNLGIRDKP